MNAIIFVLILSSGDGGINTDLKFTDITSCRTTARELINEANNKDTRIGDSAGFRYVRAICVKASNLIQPK